MVLRAAVAVVLLIVLAACGQSGSGGGSAEGVGPYADGDLVLRVAYTGGFLSPQMIAGRLPVVSVYGDGRVISEGPVPAIHPGPALPNVRVARLDPAEVRGLARQALDAGVGESADLGTPPVADMTSTRFVVSTGLETITREVYSLAVEDGEGSGLTDDQIAARAELAAFRDRVTGLGAGASEPYEPVAVAALVAPYVPDGDPQLAQPDVAWPGPALPGEPIEPMLGLGCVVATGDQATAVLRAAGGANQLTPWVAADGSRWAVTFRPLLPDETGCTDLQQS